MEFSLRYKGCSCCPFLGAWEGYHCKATDMKLHWPSGRNFDQPEWCPLVKDGRVVIKQGATP